MLDHPLPTKIMPDVWRCAFAAAITTDSAKLPTWSLAKPESQIEGRLPEDRRAESREIDQLEQQIITSLAQVNHLRREARLAQDVAHEAHFIKALVPIPQEIDMMQSALVNLESLSTSIPFMPQLPSTKLFIEQLEEHRVHFARVNERQGILLQVVALLDDTISEHECLAREADAKRVALSDDLRALTRMLQAGLDRDLATEYG
jgi:hypothetical protein